MANKKIRDYIPGQNDYLNFVQTMNKNAQIDMKKNKDTISGLPAEQSPAVSEVNTVVDVVTPTQAQPIGAQAYSTVRGGFKEVLDNGSKGISKKYTSIFGGTTESGPIQTAYDESVSGSESQGTVSAGSTKTPAVTNASTTLPTSNGGKLSYEQWMKDNNYDPETNYKQAKADLEYQYQTYLSNYGARAEELYQMGLAGSGISDIYGANAYSAYLAAANDLALAKIAQENEYRRLYKNYSTEYDAAEQLKAETEQSEIGTIASNLVSQFNYNPDKAQSFRDYYKDVEGKSDEWIDSVIESADALYNLNQSTVDKSAIKSQIDAMLANNNISYDGSTSVKSAISSYLSDNNLSQYYDELISTYDAQLEESKNAAAEDAINQEIADLNAAADIIPESVTFTNLVNNLTKYQLLHNQGSVSDEQYNKYAEAINNSATAAIQWALSDDQRNYDNLNKAYNIAGYTEEEWSTLSESEKGAAIMEAAGELYVNGVMSEDGYNTIYDEWFNQEVDLSENINDLADIVTTLQEYKDSRYISQEIYDESLKSLAGNISSTTIKKNAAGTYYLLVTMKNGKTFRLSNYINIEDDLDARTNGVTLDELDAKSEGLQKFELFEYNGKLFTKTNNGKYWCFDSPNYTGVNQARKDLVTELMKYYAKNSGGK